MPLFCASSGIIRRVIILSRVHEIEYMRDRVQEKCLPRDLSSLAISLLTAKLLVSRNFHNVTPHVVSTTLSLSLCFDHATLLNLSPAYTSVLTVIRLCGDMVGFYVT